MKEEPCAGDVTGYSEQGITNIPEAATHLPAIDHRPIGPRRAD
jgi:hypothetical protein